MQRIIEACIENRKKAQTDLKNKLKELGSTISGSFFNRSKNRSAEILENLETHIDALVLAYCKEWDAYSNNHMTKVIQSFHDRFEKIEIENANTRHIMSNFIKLEGSLKETIEHLDQLNKDVPKKKIESFKDQLSLHQYADFEQRFRGNEDHIKTKLQRHAAHFQNRDEILDIGCGRGEFVEILNRSNIKAIGIDLSRSMLKIAEEKGLDCRFSDALTFLKESDEEKFGGIFSSQVIEHFTPTYLREMVLASHRVLKKGAPIILETINPLSLFALSRIFFLDVTHQKPLHPEYMRYLLESSGFSNVEIIYSEGDLQSEKLQAIPPERNDAEVLNTNVDKLNQILYSSVEYIVKGIKI